MLKIEVNKLIELGISVEAYFLMWCIFYKENILFTKYITECSKLSTESIDKLIALGYMSAEQDARGKYVLSTMLLTEKAISLFPTGEKPEDWIDVWFELWPKGVKSGGFLLKTDKSICLKKMNKFVKDNPQYTKGIIIGATKKYLDNARVKGYEYCKLAPYFISKDGMSMLEGFCRDLQESVGKPEKREYREDRM